MAFQAGDVICDRCTVRPASSCYWSYSGLQPALLLLLLLPPALGRSRSGMTNTVHPANADRTLHKIAAAAPTAAPRCANQPGRVVGGRAVC